MAPLGKDRIIPVRRPTSIRQLVWWHCRISCRTWQCRHGALDIVHGPITGQSHANRKGTRPILNLYHEQQWNLHVDVDALAYQAFAQIDESSQRIQQLIHNHHKQQPRQRALANTCIWASCKILRQQIPRPNQFAQWHFSMISDALTRPATTMETTCRCG
jgi:hypothetical protein